MALIADLLPTARPGLPQVPDIVLTNALNRAAVRFFRDSQIWRQKLDPIKLRSGISNYDFGAPDNTRVERVLSAQLRMKATAQDIAIGSNLIAPLDLKPSNPQILFRQPIASGPPMAYALSPTDYTLDLWPTPDAVTASGYTINCYVVLAPTQNAVEIPDRYSDEWDAAIVARARAELMCNVGMPWHSPEGYAHNDAIYGDLAASAKRRATTGEWIPQRIAAPKFA